jgi:hypothetical protein
MHEKTDAATKGAIQRAIDTRAWNLTGQAVRLVVDRLRGGRGPEVHFGTIALVTSAGVELAGDGTGSCLLSTFEIIKVDRATAEDLAAEKAKAQRPAAR